MKVSSRWIRDMVPGLTGTPSELAEHLALRGAPVEDISSPGEGLDDIVVGRVISAAAHPNADRLSLCEVEGGEGVVQVVCGASNVKAGAYYPFAPVGSVLPGDFTIKKAKIRGEVSQGMLCSAKELGLGSDHEGILELEGEHTPGEPLVAALGLDDATLDVEITANRGDLMSHVGVARELASEGDGVVVLPQLPGAPEVAAGFLEGPHEVSSGGVGIRIDEPTLCSRYLGAVIRGVRVGPSPPWLQARLRGAGARPINNVVDATNYVMLELGQPLHAFDIGRLRDSSIVVRRAAEDETSFTTLDGEERALTTEMLVICDRDRPVAIAGVMGGRSSEVGDETVDVLLECALFDPKSVRATRKALMMSTDASYRFERGVDPEGMRTAIERCAALIIATAGGALERPMLDCHPRPFEPSVLELRMTRIEHLLGVAFEPEQVTRLLTPLGFRVLEKRGGVLRVRVPGFRSYDVTREVDLIEEVARTYGYDAFPDELRAFRPGTVPDHPLFGLEDDLRAALVGRGLLEAQTPAFAPRGEGDVEVANPLATTEPMMRRAILPSLLRRVEYNLARGTRDVRLFELGTSFRKAERGAPPHEEPHLAVVLHGRREPPHWSREDEPITLWDVKGLAEALVRRAYGARASVVPGPSDVDALDPSRTFLVRGPSGEALGAAGRIRDGSVDAPPWADDVWGLELNLPELPEAQPAVAHRPLPQYPAVERDLALLVPDALTIGSVSEAIRAAAGPELEALELFDVYTGEGVADRTRSAAFRLRFRSAGGTLKDKAVDRSVGTVLTRLQEDLGVTTRG